MVRVPTWEPSVSNLPGASNVPHATADTFGAQNAAALDYMGRAISSGANQFGDVIGKIGDEQNAIDAKVKTSDFEAGYNQEEIRLKRTLDPSQMYTLPEKMKTWADDNWHGYSSQIGGRYRGVADANVKVFINQKDTHHLQYIEAEKDKYIPLQIQSAAEKHYGIVRQGGEATMPAAADAIAAMIREPTSLNELEKRKLLLQTSIDLYNNVAEGMIDKHSRGEITTTQMKEWKDTGLAKIRQRMGVTELRPYGSAMPPPGSGVAVAESQQPRKMENGVGSMLTGRIVVNGRIYEFVSGGGGRGSAPYGQYDVLGYTSGAQRRAAGNTYTNDAFPLNDAHDPGVRGSQMRTGLLIHEARYGATAGCIGIRGDFEQFKKDMQAELAQNGGRMRLHLQPPSGNAENMPSPQSMVRVENNAPRGQIAPGTINPNMRPIVRTDGPGVTMPPTLVVTSDSKVAVMPTVGTDGQPLSPKLVSTMLKDGQHLGLFDNETDAAEYAGKLHQAQAQSLEHDRAVTTAGYGTTLMSAEGTALPAGTTKRDQAAQDHFAMRIRAAEAAEARQTHQIQTVAIKLLDNESHGMKFGGDAAMNPMLRSDDTIRKIFGGTSDIYLDRRRANLAFFAGPGSWTPQTAPEQMADDLAKMHPKNIDPQSPAFKHWEANWHEGNKMMTQIMDAKDKAMKLRGHEGMKEVEEAAFKTHQVPEDLIQKHKPWFTETQLKAARTLQLNPPATQSPAVMSEIEASIKVIKPEDFPRSLDPWLANGEINRDIANKFIERNSTFWTQGVKTPMQEAHIWLEHKAAGAGPPKEPGAFRQPRLGDMQDALNAWATDNPQLSKDTRAVRAKANEIWSLGQTEMMQKLRPGLMRSPYFPQGMGDDDIEKDSTIIQNAKALYWQDIQNGTLGPTEAAQRWQIIKAWERTLPDTAAKEKNSNINWYPPAPKPAEPEKPASAAPPPAPSLLDRARGVFGVK